MKPFYMSKKFWTAVCTCLAAIVAYLSADEKLAALITVVGSTLIMGFGLADQGKEAEA